MAPLEELVPLKTGNEWHYKITDYDSEGKVLSTNVSRSVVIKDTVINKSTWYILNDRTIVQNNSNGYVYFNRYNKPADQEVMIYQSTNHGGVGYMYKYPNYDLWVLTTRTYELAPIEGAIENLSGYTFEIKKEHSQPATSTSFTFRQKDYVNPNVGLVRSDKYYVDSDIMMRRTELVSYTLK